MKNPLKILVVALLSIGGGYAVCLPCSNAQWAHRVIRPFTLHLSFIRGLFQTDAATESWESKRVRLCPHLWDDISTSQSRELIWESLRLLAWAARRGSTMEGRQWRGRERGQTRERRATWRMLGEEWWAGCACKHGWLGWWLEVAVWAIGGGRLGSEGGHERLNRRMEGGETPLRGCAVTPAERFTPSTKWLVNREGSSKRFTQSC